LIALNVACQRGQSAGNLCFAGTAHALDPDQRRQQLSLLEA
jgi:hypothetical protein